MERGRRKTFLQAIRNLGIERAENEELQEAIENDTDIREDEEVREIPDLYLNLLVVLCLTTRMRSQS
jgi:hypothetical protein